MLIMDILIMNAAFEIVDMSNISSISSYRVKVYASLELVVLGFHKKVFANLSSIIEHID